MGVLQRDIFLHIPTPINLKKSEKYFFISVRCLLKELGILVGTSPIIQMMINNLLEVFITIGDIEFRTNQMT